MGAVPSPVLTRSLAPHTTLRIGGQADRLAVARTAAEVVDTVRAADASGEPLLLLGGGSNVVIADEGVPGTALLVRSTGHTVEPLPDGAVLVTAEAGEDWDALVAATVDDGARRAGVPVRHPGQHGRHPGAERGRLRGGGR